MTTAVDPTLVQLARTSPAGLAILATHHLDEDQRWVMARHHRAMIEHVLRCLRERRNAMLFMPPRAGKSQVSSVWLPAWHLLTHPTRNVILCSYGEDLATDFSSRARQVVQDFGRLWGVRVSASERAARHWRVEYLTPTGWTAGGAVVAAGVGGPLPGRGGHLIVLDDVVRGLSDTTDAGLRGTYLWFRGVLETRREPGAVVVLCMTRWARADLAGRLLEEEPHRWDVLRLPALAEEGDPLGRVPGEALWPERFPRAELEAKRDSSEEGGLLFQALYQQDPQPTDGAVFRAEWFRHYTEKDDGSLLLGEYVTHRSALHSTFATIDPNLKASERSDQTGFLVWALTRRGDLVLLDDRTRRMNGSDDLIPEMRRCRERWPGIVFYVESAAHGTEIIRAIQRTGIPVLELKADKDKVTRAYGATPDFAQGRVWFPSRAPWLAKLEGELLSFPGGRFKDRVDACAYAVAVRGERAAPNTLSLWADYGRAEAAMDPDTRKDAEDDAREERRRLERKHNRFRAFTEGMGPAGMDRDRPWRFPR